MAETTCPVFRPTEEEFKSFRRYMEEVVDPIAGRVGLCKIIPPPGWAARRRDTTEQLCKSVKIPAPIRQCISSTRSNGVYSVHVVENSPMTLEEFKKYADKRAPFPSSTASAGFPGAAAVGVRRGRSSGGSSRGAVGDVDEGSEQGGRGGSGGYGGGYGVVYGGAFEGRSACSGVREGGRAEESEVARRVRMFWRSLGPNSEAPVYGADTLGTLFAEDDDDSWNVGKLDTILQLLKSNLPGITTSMLYAGMWRSMFAFHVEDVNLYSINYLHRGDPKSWYCIPPDSRKRFESLAQGFFAEEFRACKDHLRHKTSMISPLQIQKAGIAYCTAVQGAGEFMITFPAAYHGGFNHGFNLAESTNFAIDRWIEEGRAAAYCLCSPHSVRIDVERFEALVRQHRRIAGKESTCLKGLAEVTDDVANFRTSDGGGGGEFSWRRVSKAAGKGGDWDKAVEESENDEEEEDLQVFNCVCSVNTRAVRRVRRRKRDGTFVLAPSTPAAGKASSSPWPKENTAECPRCGVWGHTACLEYVLPPQFVAPVEASAKAGGSRSRSSSSRASRGRVKGGRKFKGATQKEGVVRSPKNVAQEGDIAVYTTAAATAVPPTPLLSRAVCWRCAQEKAEIAAASRESGMMSGACGVGGGGTAAVAVPRRAGKVSGGGVSSSGVGRGGGATPTSLKSNGAGGGGLDLGRRGGDIENVTKKMRLPSGLGGAGSSIDSDLGSEGAGAEANRSAAAPLAAVAPKRARIRPRLLGKEVLVSDGVAAVLTGVVSAIEDGQARIHYKGRKAKLDEWIDIYSERFLSATEAKKQMQLARLAMNPPHASESTGGASPLHHPVSAGKKRKSPAHGGSAAAAGRKRTKQGEGTDVDKLSATKKKKGSSNSKKSKPCGKKKKQSEKKGEREDGNDDETEGQDDTENDVENNSNVARGRGAWKKNKPGKNDRVALKEEKGARRKPGKGFSEGKEAGGREGKSGKGTGKISGGKKGKMNSKLAKDDDPDGSDAVGKSARKSKGKGKDPSAASSGVRGWGGKKRGREKISSVVFPSRPAAVLRREVPGHHVISNRRAAVLARAYAKEEEEAQKEHEEEVAAAERSRVAREHRLKTSSRRRSSQSVATAPASAPASASALSSSWSPISTAPTQIVHDDAGSAEPSEIVPETPAGKCVERWPSLGFGGKPWGLGPFSRTAAPNSARGKASQGMEEEDWESDSEDGAAGVKYAAVGQTAASPRSPSASKEMMHRARVEAREAVDIGEEEAFRAWLAKLRAVQEIPIGHVEKCSRALAVTLGTSPADGSVRSSLQALLVAETLRGGGSEEVARFVRSVAGIIADAASRACPLEMQPPPPRDPRAVASPSSAGAGKTVRDCGGVVGDGPCGDPSERDDKSCVGGTSCAKASLDPSVIAIRDMEGVAAYAHALAHVARSASKQRRAWKKQASHVTAGVVLQNNNQRGKKGKRGATLTSGHTKIKAHVHGLPSSPSKLRPPPVVVGNLPGSFPFSRSTDSLLMHARAMVGLKRAHRWAKAWLALPEGSSLTRVSSETTFAQASIGSAPTAAFAPEVLVKAVGENPLLPAACFSRHPHGTEENSPHVEDATRAAFAPAAAVAATGAHQESVSGSSSQVEHATYQISTPIPIQSSRESFTPQWSPTTATVPAPLSTPWNPVAAAPSATTAMASVPGGGIPKPPMAASSPVMPSLANGYSPLLAPWGVNMSSMIASVFSMSTLGAGGDPANPAAATAAWQFPTPQAEVTVPPITWGLYPLLNPGSYGFNFGGVPSLPGMSAPLVTPAAISSPSENDTADGGVDLLERWGREGAGGGRAEGRIGDTASDGEDEDLVVVDV